MDDTLRTCHPAVSFAYFALVIACAMLLLINLLTSRFCINS